MKTIYLFFAFSFILSLSFSCNTDNTSNKKEGGPGLIKDIDGNIYHTVKIGSHIWMKENLKTTRYQNGDPIPDIKDSLAWLNDKLGAYCNFNNDTALGKEYGHLYNWYVVNDPRNVCPAGWHVASEKEFGDLDFQFGGSNMSGPKLKEGGTLHWDSPNTDADNKSEFTALGGGDRENGFVKFKKYAYFWNRENYTGDNCSEKNACASECSLCFQTSYFNRDWGYKYRGMSIRCVKDSLD